MAGAHSHATARKLGRRMTQKDHLISWIASGEWSPRQVRMAATAGLAVALVALPLYGLSAAGILPSSLMSPPAPTPKPGLMDGRVQGPEHDPGAEFRILAQPHHNPPAPNDRRAPAVQFWLTGSDPVFRRDMASLEELGLVGGVETAELPVLAVFGNERAWLKPFVGGSLALTQSYADAGHNRLIVITDPDAVIKFQGTAGLSLVSDGPSELQIFYRYIKFTDPGMRPSASLLALTDTLTSQQRQHEVMMGWRMRF